MILKTFPMYTSYGMAKQTQKEVTIALVESHQMLDGLLQNLTLYVRNAKTLIDTGKLT